MSTIEQLDNLKTIWNLKKEVMLEILLGRKLICVNNEEILCHLSGKIILVTGGGGSIGSELCMQIAAHAPKLLLIFDSYENNAYNIEQELKYNFPQLNLLVLIGSVQDYGKINSIFHDYHPEIVFHAAAHKHVPLMELSPCEAIKNNVLGTLKTAWAALNNKCKRFVLISTDKAVNPTNVMGASKRICEMIIQMLDAITNTENHKYYNTISNILQCCDCQSNIESISSKTEFVAVRFGNVLGSNGSVVPLFRKQIEHGGPVTITHPDIIRYFMTISEAVSLVLQASTFAKGGEIFILDMGEPVKIDTLARNLIQIYGLRPEIDIPIKYIGLRPGEKLYEETLMEEEGKKTTPNKQIFIGQPITFDKNIFLSQLTYLSNICLKNDNKQVIKTISEIVPTYRYSPNGYTGQTE